MQKDDFPDPRAANQQSKRVFESVIVVHGESGCNTVLFPGPHPYLYPKGTDEWSCIRRLLKDILYHLSSGSVTIVTVSPAFLFDLTIRVHTDDGFGLFQNHSPDYLEIREP